jgi:serine/threonine-protein kinase RsbW
MTVLRIPATLDELATVRQYVREQAARAGADPGAVPDVVQAVDEFVTNSIIHGYRGRDGSVEVEVDRSGRSLIVRLRDEAPPFDPTQLPPPNTNAPLDERPLGGMGVFLARDMVDSVTHQHTEAGNELTLVKECIGQHGGGTC